MIKTLLISFSIIILQGCTGLIPQKEKPIKGGYFLTDEYSCEALISNSLGIFKSDEISVTWEGKFDFGATATLRVSASLRPKPNTVSFTKTSYLAISFDQAENGLTNGKYAAALLSDSGAVFTGGGELRLPYDENKTFWFEGKDLTHVLGDSSDIELYIFSETRAVVRTQHISRKFLMDILKELNEAFEKNIENSKSEKERCSQVGVMVGMRN